MGKFGNIKDTTFGREQIVGALEAFAAMGDGACKTRNAYYHTSQAELGSWLVVSIRTACRPVSLRVLTATKSDRPNRAPHAIIPVRLLLNLKAKNFAYDFHN